MHMCIIFNCIYIRYKMETKVNIFEYIWYCCCLFVPGKPEWARQRVLQVGFQKCYQLTSFVFLWLYATLVLFYLKKVLLLLPQSLDKRSKSGGRNYLLTSEPPGHWCENTKITHIIRSSHRSRTLTTFRTFPGKVS